MADVVQDGFDWYNGVAGAGGFATRWTTVNSGASSMQTGRFGGQCVRFANGRNSKIGIAAGSSFSFQFGMRFSSMPTNASTTQNGHFWLYNGSTPQCGFGVQPDGSIVLGRYSADFTCVALAQSAGGVIINNQWHDVEIEIVISDTVGRISLWIDSVKVAEITNADTKNHASSANADWVGLGSRVFSNTGGTVDFDDFHGIDSATKPAVLQKIETEILVSDGGTLQWVPSTGSSHYAVVDEAQVNTADYLQASAVGDLDILNWANLSNTPSSIVNVQHVLIAARTDAAARSIYCGIGSSGTNSQGSALSISTTISAYLRNDAVDPHTGAAWTKSGLDAATLRLEVAS